MSLLDMSNDNLTGYLIIQITKWMLWYSTLFGPKFQKMWLSSPLRIACKLSWTSIKLSVYIWTSQHIPEANRYMYCRWFWTMVEWWVGSFIVRKASTSLPFDIAGRVREIFRSIEDREGQVANFGRGKWGQREAFRTCTSKKYLTSWCGAT